MSRRDRVRRGWRAAGALVLCGACGLGVVPAYASGFAIDEQSAKAAGRAGAWVASADDAAAVWYNPAALVRLEGMQAQVGVSLVQSSGDSLLTGDPAFGLDPASPAEFEAESELIPAGHVYFAHRLGERLAWGIGLTTPWALSTEWTEAPVTLSARRTRLVGAVVNPNLAYRLDDNWSIAAGLDLAAASVRDLSRDVAAPGTTQVIGRRDFSGDGTDVGWNVATSYASKGWAFGFTYRSALNPEMDGDVVFSEFDQFQPPDSPATATLELPAQAAIGVSWVAADVWEFEFDVTWAQWSRFDRFVIDAEDPLAGDEAIRHDWDDTIAYRVGASWALGERHELRAGLLQDETPVPGETLRPSIPDADRWSVTMGYGYTGETWAVHAFYMPVWHRDRQVDGDPAEGVLQGEYSSFRHVLGIGFDARF